MDEPTLRIGVLAELAGVSTRTVRHYHQIGLLPEPVRAANGYRSYGLAHVVGLLRIRRLSEMGLSLEEIGDALTEAGDQDLREILVELDADLALKAERIATQRARIAVLLGRPGDLRRPESVGEVMDKLRASLGGDYPGAERDEMIFEFLDAVVDPTLPSPAHYATALFSDVDTAAAMVEIGKRFEALADLDPDDPEVEALAAEARGLTARLDATIPRTGEGVDPTLVEGFFGALRADLSPAQVRCLGLWFPDSPLAQAET